MHFPTSFFKPINFSGTFFQPIRSIIYDGIAFHNLRRSGAIVLVLFIKTLLQNQRDLSPILNILYDILSSKVHNQSL